jgi:hypothetical protein
MQWDIFSFAINFYQLVPHQLQSLRIVVDLRLRQDCPLRYTLPHGFSHELIMNISIFDCFKFLMPSLILNPVLFLHRVIDLLTYLPLHLEGYDRTSTMFGQT